MKKDKFYIYLLLLIILIIFVVFYMLCIHVPYYNHTQDIKKTVSEIIEKEDYIYKDYSHEYRGYKTLYIVKVEKDEVVKYVAYDEYLNLIGEYSGNEYNKQTVINSIEDKYGFEVEDLEIGYENNQFVYYTSYMDDDSLIYVYYSLETGEFIKAIGIGDQHG